MTKAQLDIGYALWCISTLFEESDSKAAARLNMSLAEFHEVCSKEDAPASVLHAMTHAWAKVSADSILSIAELSARNSLREYSKRFETDKRRSEAKKFTKQILEACEMIKICLK